MASATAQSSLFGQCCRLDEVTGCISALQAPVSSHQPLAKLKHCHGQQESPEQLQKQLVELSELSMQVVLSMDELHSETREVGLPLSTACLRIQLTQSASCKHNRSLLLLLLLRTAMSSLCMLSSFLCPVFVCDVDDGLLLMHHRDPPASKHDQKATQYHAGLQLDIHSLACFLKYGLQYILCRIYPASIKRQSLLL